MVYARVCIVPSVESWTPSAEDLRELLELFGVTRVGTAVQFDAPLTFDSDPDVLWRGHDLSIADAVHLVDANPAPFLRLYGFGDELLRPLYDSLLRTVDRETSDGWAPWELDVNIGQHDLDTGGDVPATVQFSLRLGGDGGPTDHEEYLRQAGRDQVLSSLLDRLAGGLKVPWSCLMTVD